MTTFYLHEDDWGMINLLPAENAAWTEEIAREAQRASEENFAGVVRIGEFQIPTYHNIFVVPEEKYPIADRGIHIDSLRTLLQDKWREAERIESGYGGHTEELRGCFAFGEAHGGMGAFYGSQRDSIVTRLYIIRPSMDDTRAVEAFATALAHLGEEYNLILADWWTHEALDLRDGEAIRRYLAGQT